jgi:AcrR family transcriptional regulator
MPAPVPPTEIRARLLPAMAHLTAEKGYAAVTIDDLARAARISKRTFYAQFADKEACLLAAYEDAADLVYRECERAADQAHARGWRTQVDIIISTYLRCLAAQPAMTRVFHVEIQAAGARALELHLAVNLRYAKLLRRIVPPPERPDQPTAIALLGAVNELVLHAVAGDRTTRLPRLQSTVRPLFDAALGRNLGT